MADNLTAAVANLVLDHLHGVAAYTPTFPLVVALMTANGDDQVSGTEVTGGGYARQSVTFGAASGETAGNPAQVEFTDMPTCTVVGAEVYDSAATPQRIYHGVLTTTREFVAGDSAFFDVNEFTVSLA